MFKKLIMIALAISGSYAIEPSEELPSGNNIQQNTEEVKSNNNICNDNQLINTQTNNTSNHTNSAIFQDDEKVFLYSDSNTNITENTTNQSQLNKKNGKPFRNFVNKLFIKYPDNTKPGEKLFDLQHLPSVRQFKHMNDEEKDWARFRAYNQFAETCQSFMQMAILKKEVSQKLRRVFYLTHSLRSCIIAGLDPQQIFLDELKFNINSECYTKHLPHLQQQFDLVISHLKPIREQFRKYFIEHGIVEEN